MHDNVRNPFLQKYKTAMMCTGLTWNINVLQDPLQLRLILTDLLSRIL